MDKHCEICVPGARIFSQEEIASELNQLKNWSYHADENVIERTFSFKGFYKTMAFVNAIAWMAHQEQHHPDMKVSYNQVIVQYQSHEAGGITKNDIICARLVDSLINEKE